MNRELKRVTIIVLLMFGALFVATTIIQYVQADALANDARNTRTLYDSYSRQRGPILVNGEPVAMSVPSEDEYKYQRIYTQGPLYSGVTGYFTLGQGATGIEGALNDYLSGTSDSQFFDQIQSLVSGQNPKGASVWLTIDPVVQAAAQNALGDLQGAIVALEPATGRILAMVQTPNYDPNALAGHDIPQVIQTYEELLGAPGEPLVNNTIGGSMNPPGSTFKIVTSAAALESGLSPDHALPNPARYQLPQSSNTVANSGGGTCGGGETVTIRTAFVLSCNVPMAELGVQLGEDTMYSTASAFGFNRTDIEVPMDVEPSVFPENLDGAQLALSSFGQANVRATPLQIAMLSAAVANDGKIMTPTLVDSITAPDLSVLKAFEPSTLSEPISSITASTLSDWMVEAVRSGAATNARIGGVDVAGKTGTAENGEGDPYTLWFTGFAPADNPQVAIAVVIENGGGQGQSGSGNSVAAPIGKQVLEAVLNK